MPNLGLISRADAEELLSEDKEAGSFLIRLSDKVWGYTISFKYVRKEQTHYRSLWRVKLRP